jgi:hypothetical protein
VPGTKQTVFVAAKLLSGGSNGFAVGTTTGGTTLPAVNPIASSLRVAGVGGNLFAASPVDAWHIWHVRRDGQAASLFRNGALIQSATVDAEAEPPLNSIRGQGTLGDTHRCLVGEVLIYPRVLWYLAARHTGGVLVP